MSKTQSAKRKMQNSRQHKAVFLDRDGTMIHDPGYLNSLSKLRFYKNSIKAMKMFKKAGYKIIVLTNQSGVARGYFDEKFVDKTHKRLDEMLKKYSVKVDAYYYCPHHKQAEDKKYRKDCSCRKPEPGMVLKAKKKFNIDLRVSYVIGDKLSDVELGINTDMKSVLVMTGKGIKQKRKITKRNKPDIIAKDIFFAAKKVCKIT